MYMNHLYLYMLHFHDILIPHFHIHFYRCKGDHHLEIENFLNKEFGNVYDRFVDNKLSVYCGQGKTK